MWKTALIMFQGFGPLFYTFLRVHVKHKQRSGSLERQQIQVCRELLSFLVSELASWPSRTELQDNRFVIPIQSHDPYIITLNRKP